MRGRASGRVCSAKQQRRRPRWRSSLGQRLHACSASSAPGWCARRRAPQKRRACQPQWAACQHAPVQQPCSAADAAGTAASTRVWPLAGTRTGAGKHMRTHLARPQTRPQTPPGPRISPAGAPEAEGERIAAPTVGALASQSADAERRGGRGGQRELVLASCGCRWCGRSRLHAAMLQRCDSTAGCRSAVSQLQLPLRHGVPLTRATASRAPHSAAPATLALLPDLPAQQAALGLRCRSSARQGQRGSAAGCCSPRAKGCLHAAWRHGGAGRAALAWDHRKRCIPPSSRCMWGTPPSACRSSLRLRGDSRLRAS